MSSDTNQTAVAYFASGCFWGTQYYFDKAPGVLATRAGFMGGHVDSPSYQQVKTGQTGHLELVEVIYNPAETNFDALVRLFFETHNFTQTDGQGPDIGSQYLSALFYRNEEELKVARKYVDMLSEKGFEVATALRHAETFWPAEDYHQHYYDKNGSTPYCHIYRKIF